MSLDIEDPFFLSPEENCACNPPLHPAPSKKAPQNFEPAAQNAFSGFYLILILGQRSFFRRIFEPNKGKKTVSAVALDIEKPPVFKSASQHPLFFIVLSSPIKESGIHYLKNHNTKDDHDLGFLLISFTTKKVSRLLLPSQPQQQKNILESF